MWINNVMYSYFLLVFNPTWTFLSYIIILDPTDNNHRGYVCNITPWLTSHFIQLISGFFHINQGVLCSERAEQASSRGVLEEGEGGDNRLAK